LSASTAASAGAAAATRSVSVDAAWSTMPGDVIAPDELGRVRRAVDRVHPVLAAHRLTAGARDVAGEEGVDVAGDEGDVVDRVRGDVVHRLLTIGALPATVIPSVTAPPAILRTWARRRSACPRASAR
jgi:hypothetical protein